MRVERMLAIVIILLNRRKVTAKELAGHFEVNIRTIYRDIKAINMANIPVISNQGVDGGYELVDNFKLNKQHFSSKDMKSILSALKGVNTAVNDLELSIILEKIESLIPKKEKEKIRKSKYIVFDMTKWDNSKNNQKNMEVLYDMIKSSKLVEILYSDSKGKSSVRIIEPMTVVLKGFAWYLFAYCREKSDFRMFKLSRIKKLSPLDLSFERKEKEYNEVDFQWKAPKLEKVVLKFDNKIEFLVKDYFKRGNFSTDSDGFIVLTIDMPIDNWISGMILSYGDNVEVIEPKYLRDEIKEKILKAAIKYS